MAKGKGTDASELIARGEALTGELATAEQALTAIQEEQTAWQMGLPNWLHESVPDGADEKANVEVRRWGEPRKFDFEAKDHVELMTALRLVNWDGPRRFAGGRSYALVGMGALLEMAVTRLTIDTLFARGLTPVIPPVIAASMKKSGSACSAAATSTSP